MGNSGSSSYDKDLIKKVGKYNSLDSVFFCFLEKNCLRPPCFFFQTIEFLHNVTSALKNNVPAYWEPQMSSHGLHIVKYSTDKSRVIQRSVLLSNSRTVHIFVHGHELPSDHPAYSTVKTQNLEGFDIDSVATSLKKIVVEVRL